NNTGDLKLFGRDSNGSIVTNDLLMGTGVGARIIIFSFLLRYDVGWGYDVKGFTSPTHYLSIGIDF
ncbi:MAG: hypothetical protein WB779_03560, partial [Ignavibacteriaceae bacterium]